jgi:acetoacetyl-CoA synthetase
MMERLSGAADRIRMRLGKMARKPASDTQGLPPVLRQVRESMRVAMATYRPRRYFGSPIVYVRASVREDGQGDPLPAWQRVARLGLVVKNVEGAHTDLVVEPILATVADTLARRLTGA